MMGGAMVVCVRVVICCCDPRDAIGRPLDAFEKIGVFSF